MFLVFGVEGSQFGWCVEDGEEVVVGLVRLAGVEPAWDVWAVAGSEGPAVVYVSFPVEL